MNRRRIIVLPGSSRTVGEVAVVSVCLNQQLFKFEGGNILARCRNKQWIISVLSGCWCCITCKLTEGSCTKWVDEYTQGPLPVMFLNKHIPHILGRKWEKKKQSYWVASGEVGCICHGLLCQSDPIQHKAKSHLGSVSWRTLRNSESRRETKQQPVRREK